MEEAKRKADALIEALPYIQSFHGKPVVVKFGGSAMQRPEISDDVLEDVVFLSAAGIKPVVVHGGGKRISEAMARSNLKPNFVEGHRVTDLETLKIVVRVLTEEVNAEIIKGIEKHGGRAASTFAGGSSMLVARKKLMPAPAASDGEALDLGFVGEITSVDRERMLSMMAEGLILAVPPIGQDEAGQLYNVNADSAAAAIAVGLDAEKIVFLSDVHGIMADPQVEDSFLSTLAADRVGELIKKGVISGGMLPKLNACVSALRGGVRKAHIIDGTLPHSLLLEIFTDTGIGTQILG